MRRRQPLSGLSARILKAMGLFGGVQGVGILCSVVRVKLAALWLGPAGVALFGIFNGAVDMVRSFSQLGLRSSSVRDVACHRREPLLGQIVAEASIDTPADYMRSTFMQYLQRRNFLIKALNKIPGVYTPMPMGAFYTVASLPVDDADHFCAWCLSDFSYNGQTVFMAPASGFYTDPGLGRNEVRIAYVLEIPELERAVEVLAKALEAYPGKNV